MAKGKEISMWTVVSNEEAKAALPRLGRVAAAEMEVVKVGTDTLAENLRIFLADFEPILAEQPTDISGYHIDEIELSLGVDARGGIELVGKLDAGVQAGIKIKLKRNK